MGARIIAVANEKGGVGKTATVTTLAYFLAYYERRTLIVDLNPEQSNASSYYGLNKEVDTVIKIFQRKETREDGSVVDLGDISEFELRSLIKHTEYAYLDMIPGNRRLFLGEGFLDIDSSVDGHWYILKKALSYIKNDYDYIFIDCGPSKSMLMTNALLCIDGLLIPLQDAKSSLDGLRDLLKFINTITNKRNPGMEILGVFLTMVDPRTTGYLEYRDTLEKTLGKKMLGSYIRFDSAFKDADITSPVPVFKNDSPTVLDYERLLYELNLLDGKEQASLHVDINVREKREKSLKEKRKEQKERSIQKKIEAALSAIKK